MAPTQVYIYEEEEQDPEEGLGDFSSSCLRLKNIEVLYKAVFCIYTQEKIQSGINIHHYMFRANVEFDYNRCHYPSKMSFTRYQRPN